MSIPMSAAVVASSRDPKERARLGENRPEMRRRLIIAALKLIGARLVRSDPRDGTAALERAVDLGVITRAKLDFLRHAHAYWKADPNADSSFTSVETEDGEGLVPYFFTRTAAPMGAPISSKLAWHATDALTPIFSDLPDVLADDAAAVATGVRLLGVHSSVYVVTTMPGHHACAEHYGGYCFVNNAAFGFKLLRDEYGRRPFLIDIDYHAGDGTFSLLGGDDFASLHAALDYPYLDKPQEPTPLPPTPSGEPWWRWSVHVPPGAGWRDYEPLLRAALGRRAPDCDCLVVSLGYDTLRGDPDARDGHRLALTPDDFGSIGRVLSETGLSLLVLQEGGYDLDEIPAACQAFWGAVEAYGREGPRPLI